MTRLVEDERSKNFKIEILNFKRYNLVSFTILSLLSFIPVIIYYILSNILNKIS